MPIGFFNKPQPLFDRLIEQITKSKTAFERDLLVTDNHYAKERLEEGIEKSVICIDTLIKMQKNEVVEKNDFNVLLDYGNNRNIAEVVNYKFVNAPISSSSEEPSSESPKPSI